jgi:hypothetical protein
MMAQEQFEVHLVFTRKRPLKKELCAAFRMALE